MTRSSTEGHIETSSPHWIEWTTGAVSLLLVCCLLGWLGWDVYRYQEEVADFELTVVSIDRGPSNFRVNFDIHNVTQSTAAQVHVVGTLDGETADVTFDYVASESRDRGTLFFTADPGSGDLRLQVAGYTQP